MVPHCARAPTAHATQRRAGTGAGSTSPVWLLWRLQPGRLSERKLLVSPRAACGRLLISNNLALHAINLDVQL